MNFASPYVYDNVADDSYEVVSDEEFMQGMELSGSDDSEEELGFEAVARAVPEPSGAPAPATAPAAESGDVTDSAGGSQASPKPSILGRVMGLLSSSSGSRKGSSQSQPESRSDPKHSKDRAPESRRSKSSRSHHWKSEFHARQSTDGSSRGRKFRRADTNIVSLRFDTLKKPSTMHAGEVIKCAGCEAIMSNLSTMEDDGPDKVWRCEFCGHRSLVDIEEEEKPAADDVTYLIEAALTTTAIGTSGRDESIVVFCIDISGSMTMSTKVPGHMRLRGSATLRRLCRENSMEGPQRMPGEESDVTYVSRLQAVQAAVDHQLGEMAKEFPDRRVALVTFSSEVSVIGDGTGEVVSVSGQKLMNREELTEVGSQLPLPRAIREVRASLGDKIFGLEEGGSTALGPAMVVALSLASRQPGSKVILCTDGKSNEGVGKVEHLAESDPSPEEFYQTIAASANAQGVSVSVVTISGTDCKLIHLGKLASATGGQVNIVDPLKLTEEFSNVLADRIIATNVVATFIVHRDLYIGREESAVCKERREIGNVSSEQEVSFEFGLRKKKGQKDKNAAAPKPQPLDPIDEVSFGSDEKASSSAPTVSDGGGDGKTEAARDQTEAGPTAATAITPVQEPASASNIRPGGAGSEGTGDGSEEELPPELPFQVQLTYTDVDGTKALRVLTQKKPVTKDRNVAERDVDLNVLAKHTERRTSELALQGDYSGSRGVALMNQRLGWRCSHLSADNDRRRVYRKVFGRVKTVENCVSDRQTRERMTYGRTHSDEEMEEEEDEVDCVRPRVPPPLPDMCAALSARAAPPLPSGRPKSILKKKMKLRSEEADDSFAKILYHACSSSKSDDKDTDKDKDKGSKK